MNSIFSSFSFSTRIYKFIPQWPYIILARGTHGSHGNGEFRIDANRISAPPSDAYYILAKNWKSHKLTQIYSEARAKSGKNTCELRGIRLERPIIPQMLFLCGSNSIVPHSVGFRQWAGHTKTRWVFITHWFLYMLLCSQHH